VKAKERCCNTSFLISFRIGYTGPSFMKGLLLLHSQIPYGNNIQSQY
jgi:hypothetical protein